MAAEAADLLALVSAAAMPLHRCYKALKSSIGERLQQYTSAHAALIEVASLLLDAAPPPPAAHLDIKQRAQLVSLLLACTAESQTAPTAADHAAAAALGAAQPRMLRQLHKTYNVGDAASVARAAEALAAEREWAEVAQIVREFGLYERIDPLPVLRELVVAENYACALKLVARRPALQLALIRELVAREQHKLAARYVGRFKMGAIVPPPLLRELAFALHRRRVAWLVNSRNHDLIDEFFAQAAAALRAHEVVRRAVDRERGRRGAAHAVGEAGHAERRVHGQPASAASEEHGAAGAKQPNTELRSNVDTEKAELRAHFS